MTTFEEFKLELEKIVESREEGTIEGIIEGRKEKAKVIIENILVQFPDWTDQQISEFIEEPIPFVKSIRANFEKK